MTQRLNPFDVDNIAKVYEPTPRNKDGMQYIRHRFHIKGGITAKEVMSKRLLDNMMSTNALMRYIMTAKSPDN